MDTITEKTKEGLYIYGIIRHQGPVEFGPIGIGKRDDMVFGISYRDICAVVSKSPVIQYEARRINLTTHEKVLEEVMKQFTVLPVRFSTVSEQGDGSGIQKILTREYDKFHDLLNVMDGKKELGIKVMAQEAAIYESIIEKYENIKSLRSKLINLPPDKTYYQRMKIGEMVAQALTAEKELLCKEIRSKLDPIAVEVKINDNYGELMILNAAFLIKNEAEPVFDEEVNKLDAQFGNYLTFKYVGTLPPYNFVNLVISTKDL
jgi:hypothetical protein